VSYNWAVKKTVWTEKKPCLSRDWDRFYTLCSTVYFVLITFLFYFFISKSITKWTQTYSKRNKESIINKGGGLDSRSAEGGYITFRLLCLIWLYKEIREGGLNFLRWDMLPNGPDYLIKRRLWCQPTHINEFLDVSQTFHEQGRRLISEWPGSKNRRMPLTQRREKSDFCRPTWLSRLVQWLG